MSGWPGTWISSRTATAPTVPSAVCGAPRPAHPDHGHHTDGVWAPCMLDEEQRRQLISTLWGGGGVVAGGVVDVGDRGGGDPGPGVGVDVPFGWPVRCLWMLIGRRWPDPADPRALRRFAPSPFEAAVHQVIEVRRPISGNGWRCCNPQQVYA